MRFMTKQLELHTILKAVAKHAKTETVSNRILSLEPSTDLTAIKQSLNEVDDLRFLIVQCGSLPLIPDFDIYDLINYANHNRSYALAEILQIRLFLAMEKDVINYFKNVKSRHIKIRSMAVYESRLINHQFLFHAMNKMIDDEGLIKDDATSELLHIRKQLLRLDKSLQDKLSKLVSTYSNHLSDHVVVIRNNRYCIGVKEGSKNKVKGVIHDISASGQTVYIEPEQTRQITAEIESLHVQEIKEVERIIAMISNQIQDNYESLANNLDILITFDFLQAKALEAIQLDGIVPSLNDEGIIDLKLAKHPLLDLKEAVPISFEINDKHKVLLITGPNTGGKTVALKTLGLLTLMTQCGLLIPAHQSSNIAIFSQIYADIGDEQSISQSLSTFSSHLTSIIKMTNHVSKQTLILLDELGSGTDPNEGVSLAMAILNYFRSYDIRMMVTTHYSELKRYAYEQPDIQTASVAFDKESLKPLYHIHMGTTGSSHAFLIAKRLGLHDSIINEANLIYAGRQTDIAKLMEQLNDEMMHVTEEKEHLLSTRKHLQEEINMYQSAKKEFLTKQDQVLEKIKEKEYKSWKNKKDELEHLLNDIKQKSQLTQPEYAAYKNKLNQSKNSNQKVVDDETLIVGDHVFITPYQQYGIIKAIKGQRYEVTFGHFKLTFDRSDLRKDASPKKTKKHIVPKTKKHVEAPTTKRESSLSLDLRGYRYEEVKIALEQAIDRAMLSGLHTLRIIHGFGTGAVRKAVYAYIKHSPYIQSSRYGGEGEGLNGVTIVTLK